MGTTSKKYSSEIRDRAVRLFQEHLHEYRSRAATMRPIAEKIGCTTETLRAWILRAEVRVERRRNAAQADRERVKQLDGKSARLRRADEVLCEASTLFARAEFDRREK